jgi:hypothetical protein
MRHAALSFLKSWGTQIETFADRFGLLDRGSQREHKG